MSTPIIDNSRALLFSANTFQGDQTVIGKVYFGTTGAAYINSDGSGHTNIYLPNSGAVFQTNHSTSLGIRVSAASGMILGNTAGSYPGSNKVNAEGYEISGTALPVQTMFESAGQTITAAGTLTLAHGLGVIPNIVDCALTCTTAELGYSIGDEVRGPGIVDASANYGVTMWADATNVYVQYGQGTNVFKVLKRTALIGQANNITPGNWTFKVRAFA